MKAIRKILVKILGIKGFIKLASKTYLLLVKNGFLKKKYPELFFLQEFIKDGSTSIDIGANVGYYSYFLSKYSGSNGKVYAVEPIPMFGEIWIKNTRKTGYKNLTLYPYALGAENTLVKMGIPEVDGVLHHGMTKIVSTREEKYLEYYDVEMKIPDELFGNIEKIDFIKCDVEGYENYVFSNMQETIKTHMPFIQSELSGYENRKKVIEMLEGLGYITQILENGKLRQIVTDEIKTLSCDFYFTPRT
jgi:FkbM family methyltransferase